MTQQEFDTTRIVTKTIFWTWTVNSALGVLLVIYGCFRASMPPIKIMITFGEGILGVGFNMLLILSVLKLYTMLKSKLAKG